VGLAQAGDPVGGGGEQDALSLPCGSDAEGGGQVGFAGARWAEQDHVAVLGQVGPGGQRMDRAAGGGLVVEVEVLEGLDRGHPGGSDPQLGAGGVAGGDFTFQDGGQVLLVGPAGVAGVVGQAGGGSVIRGAFSAAARWVIVLIVSAAAVCGGGLGGHDRPPASRPKARS
jgi:hypothetical protein